jgi:predicted porin
MPQSFLAFRGTGCRRWRDFLTGPDTDRCPTLGFGGKMKRSLTTLVAALGALSGASFAQTSSVTLYGILDTGVRAVRNGDGATVKSLTNDGLATSRLGFRGEENLGGGLKAGFVLEAGIGLDVGSAGVAGATAGTTGAGSGPAGASQQAKFFSRRSTVGLSGPFGEFRLGRDYVPTFFNVVAFDVYGGAGIANAFNLIGGTPAGFGAATPANGSLSSSGTLGSNAGTLFRADNAVQYFLPAGIGGVYGQVMAAAGEGSNATNGNNRYVGGRIGWAGGPVNVAGAYSRTRIPGNDDFRVWNVGGAFTLPVVKVTALYHRADYEPAGLAGRTQKAWTIGVNVPIGQSEIRATYGRSDMSGGTLVGLRNEDDARQYAAGYIYNLSRRTALYADVGRLQNKGLSQLSIPGGTTAGSNFGTVADRSSTALGLGVRHSF